MYQLLLLVETRADVILMTADGESEEFQGLTLAELGLLSVLLIHSAVA